MNWRDLPGRQRAVVTDILVDAKEDRASFSLAIADRASWDAVANAELERMGAEIAALDAAIEHLEGRA